MSGSYDFLTAKYYPDGNVSWFKTYDGGGDDRASAVAVDRAGCSYVTGRTHNGANYDFLTVSYFADGDERWTRVYDSGKGDQAYDIAIDSTGNLYVTGTTFTGPDWDMLLVKYDSQGNEIGSLVYDTGEDDGGTGIVVGDDGCIYVCGGSGDGPDTMYDYLTIKYRQFFTVSGKVEGSAYAGTRIELSGDTSISIYLEADGSYEFADLACDGSYTVTPSLTGYSFSPPYYSYSPLACDRTDQDFTSTEGVQEGANPSLSLELERTACNSIVIRFSIPGSRNVRLGIFDASGTLVERLVEGSASTGSHRIVWDGEAGVYFVSLEKDNTRITRKLVIVR